MDDHEKIQSFGDMVDATEKLTKPWRWALLFTNLFWALVFALFIALAYLTPDTSVQYQDISSSVQYQTTGSETPTPQIVTDGD